MQIDCGTMLCCTFQETVTALERSLYLYWTLRLLENTCIVSFIWIKVFESFLNFFLVCYPADLGELCESQPSSDALREGDCQRGRKPLTERHAVQPGPAEHLHTDGKTGELSDRNVLNIRLTWTQRLHSVHTHCMFLFRCCVRPEWHRTHALKKGRDIFCHH